jgi:hypothetical protein
MVTIVGREDDGESIARVATVAAKPTMMILAFLVISVPPNTALGSERATQVPEHSQNDESENRDCNGSRRPTGD